MKDICEKSVDLGPGQFCTFDDREFLDNVKSKKGKVMVLEAVKYRDSDTHSAFDGEYMDCAFSVYGIEKPGDFAANDTTFSECKAIARKVITRIRKNAYPEFLTIPAPFRTLKRETTRGAFTRVSADGRIGYTCDFTLFYQISNEYNNADWTD
ncbi:MAG: hypothetical protein ACKVPJ_13410 [Chitinophagales bacterium]